MPKKKKSALPDHTGFGTPSPNIMDFTPEKGKSPPKLKKAKGLGIKMKKVKTPKVKRPKTPGMKG